MSKAIDAVKEVGALLDRRAALLVGWEKQNKFLLEQVKETEAFQRHKAAKEQHAEDLAELDAEIEQWRNGRVQLVLALEDKPERGAA